MNKFHYQAAIGALIFAAVLAAFIFLAAVASTAFMLPANAQEPNTAAKKSQCRTIEQFVETLNALPAQVRNTLTIRILKGDDAARWVEAFNAIPPASNIRVDRVVFVTSTEPGPVILAGELDGCVTGVVRVHQSLHERILKDSNNERGEAV